MTSKWLNTVDEAFKHLPPFYLP